MEHFNITYSLFRHNLIQLYLFMSDGKKFPHLSCIRPGDMWKLFTKMGITYWCCCCQYGYRSKGAPHNNCSMANCLDLESCQTCFRYIRKNDTAEPGNGKARAFYCDINNGEGKKCEKCLSHYANADCEIMHKKYCG